MSTSAANKDYFYAYCYHNIPVKIIAICLQGNTGQNTHGEKVLF
jgi:hypothetical protein